MPSFLVSIAEAIFLMPALVFWPLLALMLLLDFVAITRKEDHWGWMTLLTIVSVVAFALHVRPAPWVVGFYFIGHLIFGLFYTSWRTRTETRMFNYRASAFLKAMLSSNTKNEWPYHFRFNPEYDRGINETARTDFDFIFTKVSEGIYANPDAIRDALIPSNYLPQFVGRLVAWTLLWPVFLGGNLTINLGKNLKRLFLTTLSGWFKGIINRNFKVALPPTPPQA
jgi:hypothetical protein